MNKVLMIFFLFINILILCFPNDATSQEGPPIDVSYPLLPSYMDKKNISLGFCDVNPYISPPRNIHIGIDIFAPAEETVFSLCDGKVVYDKTNEEGTTYWNSFLIIEHRCDGHILFAYYGHVFSNVNDPNNIKKGEKIAKIRHDTSGSVPDHLHLSISTGKDWDRYGWGYVTKCEDAITEGYKNPLTYLNFMVGTAPRPPENLKIISF